MDSEYINVVVKAPLSFRFLSVLIRSWYRSTGICSFLITNRCGERGLGIEIFYFFYTDHIQDDESPQYPTAGLGMNQTKIKEPPLVRRQLLFSAFKSPKRSPKKVTLKCEYFGNANVLLIDF